MTNGVDPYGFLSSVINLLLLLLLVVTIPGYLIVAVFFFCFSLAYAHNDILFVVRREWKDQFDPI